MTWLDDLLDAVFDFLDVVLDEWPSRWRRRAARRRHHREQLAPIPPGPGIVLIKSNGLADDVDPGPAPLPSVTPSGALRERGWPLGAEGESAAVQLLIDALKDGRPVLRPDPSVLGILDTDGQWLVLLRDEHGWRRQ